MSVGDTLDLLAGPLAFLLAAALLAALLDEVRLFEALADRFVGGRHVVLGLWVLGTLTVALVNLDAAVVLLTPLCLRLAPRLGLPVLPLALMPALLALLASSFLPVSNLTTLVVVQSDPDLRTADLVQHLGLPSLAAVVVGWLAFRGLVGERAAVLDLLADADEPAVLRTGLAVLVPTVVAFVALPALGLEPWPAAVVADLVLLAIVRRFPWRSVPWHLAVVVPLVAIAAVRAAELLDAHPTGVVPVALAGAITANVANNLPALLGGLVSVGGDDRWALLLGVNAAAGLTLWGSLSTLLARTILRDDRVVLTARAWLALNLRVTLPAFAAALLVLLLQPW